MSEQTRRVSIVGAKFRPPANYVLNQLPNGQELVLRREPENPYDPNAIAVDLPEGALEVLFPQGSAERAELNGWVSDNGAPAVDFGGSLQLGYIPRNVAENWAPVFDQEGASPPARIGFDASGKPEVVVIVEGGEDEEASSS